MEDNKIIWLDSELDKLRDKTLSFGCIVVRDQRERTVTRNGVDKYLWVDLTRGDQLDDYVDYQLTEVLVVIWHPLTRWRIEHIFRNNKPADPDWTSCIPYRFDKCYRDIGFCLNEMWETTYDQNELQRQLHAKRPRLKGLLKQFSDYL